MSTLPSLPSDARVAVEPRLALPIAIGSLLRVGFAALAPLAPQWDGQIYVRGGELLAASEPYSQRILDPAAPPTPTAFFPVGFPAVIAALRRLGIGLRGDLLVQAIAGSLTLLLLAYVARKLVGPRLAERAVWIHALSPGAVLLTGTWLAEPLVTLGVVAALAFATRFGARRPILACVGLGLVLGLTSYLRATPLAMVPPIAFGLGLVRRRGWLPAFGLATAATIAALVPLTPWAARNAAALGSPVLVSTNGGANLLIGTHGDGSYRELARPPRCGATASELSLDRCRTAVAVERIRSAPFAWLGRGLSKLWHTFGHDSAPAQHLALANAAVGGSPFSSPLLLGLGRAHWTVMLGLALFGAIARSMRRAVRSHVIVFAPLAGLSLLHFVYLGGDRYHAPIAPLLAILAAEATARLGRTTSDASRRET